MLRKKKNHSNGAIVVIGLLLFVLIAAAPAAAATRDVYPGDDLRDIVANQIEAGDTVIVHAGTYSMTPGAGLQITKPDVTLRGEDRETSIIQFFPYGGGGTGISIGLEDPANNCTVENLTVAGLHQIGFGLAGSENSVVKNCILNFSSGGLGVSVASPNCTIEGNIIDGGENVLFHMAEVAVTLKDNVFSNTTSPVGAIAVAAGSGVIENNTFMENNAAGITIGYGATATVTGNHISSQGVGLLLFEATVASDIYGNEFSDNDGANIAIESSAVAQNWVSPEAVTYTYDGATYTGRIGNYYDDYTGVDADGDGIGDTGFVLPEGLGTDTAPLIAPLDQYTFGDEPGPEPTTVNLALNPTPAETGINGTVDVALVLDEFPAGLSGYILTVTLADPSVATITNVAFPAWAGLNETGELPAGDVRIKAIDLEDAVPAGETDVVLATLTLTGRAAGTSNITVTNILMDDDDGNAIEADVTDGRVVVSDLPPFPDCEQPPRDLDGDGVYEDVNGNGLFDFDDIVAFFQNIEWAAANLSPEILDVNGNGRIDFADIVGLYQRI